VECLPFIQTNSILYEEECFVWEKIGTKSCGEIKLTKEHSGHRCRKVELQIQLHYSLRRTEIQALGYVGKDTISSAICDDACRQAG